MNGAAIDEELAYWLAEEKSRAMEVEQANARGVAPHLLAAADLRLREVRERLAAMTTP